MKFLATWRSGLGTIALVAAVSAGEPDTPLRPEAAPQRPDNPPSKSVREAAVVVSEVGIPIHVLRERGWLSSEGPTLVRPEVIIPPEETRVLRLERRRYGGLLGEALASKEPWQWFNPLAPPEYGDGTRYLRQDPFTGRAEGVILFSIRLRGGTAGSFARKHTKEAIEKVAPRERPAAAAAPDH